MRNGTMEKVCGVALEVWAPNGCMMVPRWLPFNSPPGWGLLQMRDFLAWHGFVEKSPEDYRPSEEGFWTLWLDVASDGDSDAGPGRVLVFALPPRLTVPQVRRLMARYRFERIGRACTLF